MNLPREAALNRQPVEQHRSPNMGGPVNHPHDWGRALSDILSEIAHLMTAGKGEAQILCPVGIHLFIVASNTDGEQGQTVLMDQSVSGLAFKQNRPVIVPDVDKEKLYKRFAGDKMHSEIAIPLPHKIGVINIESTDHDAFSEDDVATIKDYEQRIVQALPNAITLLEFDILLQVEREIEQEIAQQTTVGPSQAIYDKIYAVICETAQKLVGAEHIQLLVPEEDKEHLKIVFSSHPSDRTMVCIDNSICGEAVLHRENKNIPDVRNEAHYQETIPWMRSELVVIAREGQKVFAVINAESSRLNGFTSHHETLLALFAQQAGRALRQLQFAQTLQTMQAEKSAAQTIVGAAYIFANMLHNMGNAAKAIRYWMHELHSNAGWTSTLEEEATLQINSALERLTSIPQQFQQTLEEAERVVGLDLNDIVERAAQAFRGGLSSLPDVRLNADCSGNIIVLTSAYFLEQVVHTLIANAFDAVSAAGGEIRVKTRIRPEAVPGLGVCAELEVTDTGTGMDQETLRRLLDPGSGFTTKKKAPTPFGGMGFGFSWVKYFISRFRTSLQVTSEPSKGTTFLLWVPLANEQPATITLMK